MKSTERDREEEWWEMSFLEEERKKKKLNRIELDGGSKCFYGGRRWGLVLFCLEARRTRSNMREGWRRCWAVRASTGRFDQGKDANWMEAIVRMALLLIISPVSVASILFYLFRFISSLSIPPPSPPMTSLRQPQFIWGWLLTGESYAAQ